MGAATNASRDAVFVVDRVVLREVRLPFLRFFETSFGRVHEKEAVLVEVEAGGLSGWGECAAAEGPFFSYEDKETAWSVLSRFLVPWILDGEPVTASGFGHRVRRVRGHPMAKAALEAALWDLQARSLGMPLWKLLGGTRKRIPCGVSIGIQDDLSALFERIEAELEAGYLRIKIKVAPGWDVEIVEQVRERFGDIPLMVDANSAYGPEDFPLLQQLDGFDLLMIEQPLHHEDLLLHSRLQAGLRTPVCLDESIRHCRDVELALELKACRVINLKPGRVGGATESRALHDLTQREGIPLWCGGMLETGIGRAHNVALSTLANFRLPGDVSASSRYFSRDVIDPPVEVDRGWITPPMRPGIGYQPDLDWIEAITSRRLVLRREKMS